MAGPLRTGNHKVSQGNEVHSTPEHAIAHRLDYHWLLMILAASSVRRPFSCCQTNISISAIVIGELMGYVQDSGETKTRNTLKGFTAGLDEQTPSLWGCRTQLEDPLLHFKSIQFISLVISSSKTFRHSSLLKFGMYLSA
jgi:hypothetical protein